MFNANYIHFENHCTSYIFLVIRRTKIFLSNNLEYKHCDSTSLSEIMTIMSIGIPLL